MKWQRLLPVLLALALCTVRAYAVSPFDDRLTGSPDEAKVLAVRGEFMGYAAPAGDGAPTALLDSAVKLYRLSNREFLDAIEHSALGRVSPEGSYTWTLPLNPGTGYAYALVGPDSESGDFASAVSPGGGSADGRFDFLWYPESVEELLSAHPSADQAFFILVPGVVTTFLYIRSGEEEVLYPYSARPDLLGLDNQTACSPEEVWTAVLTGWPEDASPLAFPAAEEDRGYRHQPLAFFLLLLILLIPLLTWRFLRRGKKR